MAKKRANGEGNIRKRKDGRWEGRYTAGYDEKTGKRLIKNVLGKTQAEVKEKLAKAVAEAETVDVRRADEYTLGTWLQTWYELYAKPHLRFSTAEYYRRGIELHITPRIGDIPLKKLTGRDLQGLYKDLREHGRLREAQKNKQPGLSDSTIRGIHTMLCSFRKPGSVAPQVHGHGGVGGDVHPVFAVLGEVDAAGVGSTRVRSSMPVR